MKLKLINTVVLKSLKYLFLGMGLIIVSYTCYISMKLLIIISVLFNWFSFPPDSTSNPYIEKLRSEVITINHHKTNERMDYVFCSQLYQNGCDTLSNVKFWRTIMNLHKDTGLFNLPNGRLVLSKTHTKEWDTYELEKKNCFKDSLRNWYCLPDSARILLTSGKSFFYDFDKASLNFHKGINCFIANNVDPWYAQAILLIESPNKLQKSNAGAYGSFQLMKDVARMYGLKVNKTIDERANFDRSAYAASSLIKNICIPKAKQMLDSLGIRDYQETDLWFRLLVMHNYHAGAGNVKRALFSFKPTEGNMDLIYTLWRTETKQFKSASQNYSQLVLAAMLEMNQRIGLAPQPLALQPEENSITELR